MASQSTRPQKMDGVLASWESRTRSHGILAATAFAGLMELAGGADRAEASIGVAAFCFAIAGPINAYLYLIMASATDLDARTVCVRSFIFMLLMLVGMIGMVAGVSAVFWYFSPVAGCLIPTLSIWLLVHNQSLQKQLDHMRKQQAAPTARAAVPGQQQPQHDHPESPVGAP